MNAQANNPLPVAVVANLSAAMLSRIALNEGATLRLVPLTLQQAREMLPKILAQFASPAGGSAVGYRNSADCLSHLLGHRIPMNRAPISLEIGDAVLLAHISGARLDEFATQFGDATHCQFFRVDCAALDEDGAA